MKELILNSLYLLVIISCMVMLIVMLFRVNRDDENDNLNEQEEIVHKPILKNPYGLLECCKCNWKDESWQITITDRKGKYNSSKIFVNTKDCKKTALNIEFAGSNDEGDVLSGKNKYYFRLNSSPGNWSVHIASLKSREGKVFLTFCMKSESELLIRNQFGVKTKPLGLIQIETGDHFILANASVEFSFKRLKKSNSGKGIIDCLKQTIKSKILTNEDEMANIQTEQHALNQSVDKDGSDINLLENYPTEQTYYECDEHISAFSIKGSSHEVNQDTYFFVENGENAFFGVCDGVTNAIHSERTVQVVKSIILDHQDCIFAPYSTDIEFKKMVKKIITEEVWKAINEKTPGGASTLTLLVKRLGKMYCFNVGDSPAYRINTENEDDPIELLSSFDSRAMKEFKNKTMIDERDYRAIDCLESNKKPVVHCRTVEFNKQDLFLVCSDGLHFEELNDGISCANRIIERLKKQLSINAKTIVELDQMEHDDDTTAVVYQGKEQL